MAGVSKLGAALAVALAAAPIGDGALRVEVDRLIVAVSTARHLPAHSVPAALVTREDAARQAALALGARLADPRAATEGALLRRLGLLPPGRAGDAAWWATPPRADARYDSVTGRLVVPDDVPLDAQRPVLAHEIAHALADQRFGLRRFLQGELGGGRRLEGDGARARLALVEGDATLAGLETLDPREAFLAPPELDTLVARLGDALAAAPEPAPWLAALERFTHLDGFLFVARVRSRRPWSAVDALWADPPASTEQVLHPDRYETCDAPIAVDVALLPALAGLGRPERSDVLGELIVRAWLGLALPPDIAARGATGWGGDRAGLYARAGTTEAGPNAEAPLAWLTVWDDAGEADDFARAAAQVLARSAEASAEPPPDGARASAEPPDTARAAGHDVAPSDYDGRGAAYHSAGGLFALGRAGAAVALLLGAPEAALPALDQMLDAWRRQDAVTRRAARRPGRAARPGCPRRDRAAGSP